MDKKGDKLFSLESYKGSSVAGMRLLCTAKRKIGTGEPRLDIRNLKTKREALRCQLTEEHVSNEKIPARSVDVRSTSIE
jgi:hypothetical protein